MSIFGEDLEPTRGLAVDPAAEAAVEAVVPHFMPAASLALYARWWQLETWLRELAYVELRASAGMQWGNLVKAAAGRQQADAAFRHMTGADNENPLAYLDYSQLVELFENNWALFEYALIERRAWQGRQKELTQIRHRIGHLRRPHPDDLGRLEQTLRDLERGTFIALASYNRRQEPSPDRHHDPVTDGWVRNRHSVARRLVSHAERQYDTTLIVRASRRPWAVWPTQLDGATGVLWHAEFIMRGRSVDARALWHDSSLVPVRPLCVHLVVDDPSHVGFTFSAADSGQDVADAIGAAFDAVLMVSRARVADEEWARLARRTRNLDFRVLHATGWNIVDDTTLPISNFGAGGGVEVAPEW